MIEYYNKLENSINRLPLSILIVSLFAIHGYRKGSLNKSGAISAFFTGIITCYCGPSFAFILLSFYFSSSYLTKYKSSIKKKIEDGHAVGGQRNYVQVFSNSLTATCLSIIFSFFTTRSTTIINYKYDYFTSFILSSFIGHYSCCNGDTWASELGILSKGEPILITSGKKVPKGTNGGLSLIGLIASVMGGLFIGISFSFCNYFFNRGYPLELEQISFSYLQQTISIILLATFGGLVGSLIDSLMGATLQLSLLSINRKVVLNDVKKVMPTDKIRHISGTDILDNHQVNFLSSLVTAILCGYIGSFIF
ncbi:hypothetical protein DICPUDRAFT_86423 [Dictyostelium purpureum]|uniref:Transmembrane protein 19 n=1 Tax=Dictyostelium purpureum TaxID=5786 RepID=F0ZBJ4_DICPU|nr:uncharacterized protein DICPUDRAFT_86423 [Dictyostelium purpureum]EGC38676.1 hypothetical protein DICPUDRAFT_86423 [Dictyostelium purpureum]|eukprot:XP_003284772.1 hypothetical protein DICPUDRAFT_86423 [Dictyostelium purpureum]